MTLSDQTGVISVGAAVLAVFVSAWAIREARRTAPTGTYFSEMAAAYADYLRTVSNFVFERGLPERDAMAGALNRLFLFASPEISEKANALYTLVLQWGKSAMLPASPIDELLNELVGLMRADLDLFRKTGQHGTGP